MRKLLAHPRTCRASRETALVRVLGAMLLVVFGWSVSLAFVSPCSVHDEAGDASRVARPESTRGDGCCPHESAERAETDRDEGDDDGHCSCPVDCGSCCDGAGVVALQPDVPVAPTVFAELSEIPVVEHAPCRAEREPRGVFHVPRAA